MIMRRSLQMAPGTLDAGATRADARRSTQQAAPSASSALMADPGDLVARALAILAEESMMGDERQSVDQPVQPRALSGTTGDESRSVDQPLQRRVLSDGTQCRLPVRYFDNRGLIATFLTDLDRATELLKGTGLQAVPQEDGKAVALLGCFEYRKTDLGPYNEVGLVVLAVAPGDPIPANYVANLPVNTAVSDRAGREIWGYNKFVATIDVKCDGKKFSTTLRDPENTTICVLEGARGASVPLPPTDIFTFSLLEGRLIKTLIRMPTPFQAGSGDSFMFKVGRSRHPMANNLRTLALDGVRPVLVQYADPFQALLFPGRAL
jgi:Acetoacetate decarboxylase (ADC)